MKQGRLGYNSSNDRYGLLSSDLWIDTGFHCICLPAMLFSIAGGVFAYLIMCLTIRRFPERLLWVVSVLAAFGHNAGQLLVAVWVTGTPSILVYAPALVAASVITGAFTGAAAMYLVRALRKTGHFPQA